MTKAARAVIHTNTTKAAVAVIRTSTTKTAVAVTRTSTTKTAVAVIRTSMGGDHVRWLEDGDTVQVQSWFDGWAYIGDGYIQKKYLEVSE